MKTIDVVGICNALVDILVEAHERDIENLALTKGVMHLVDSPRQAEVLKALDGKSQTIELGGSALNAIRTLAALGKKTAFAGMVGPDHFGKKIAGRMQELGIQAHLGETDEATGSCVILITPDGERTMNTHLGASRLYDERQVPHREIAAAKIVHFCGYQWDTDGQKRAIKHAISTAREHQTLVSFDVADPFVVGRYRDDFLDVIRADADIVFANREEAKMLWGSGPEDAARRIADADAIAVIKLGAEGALIRRGDETIKVPPVPTKVVDSTAAGDMFAAGFLHGMTSGLSLQQCGLLAATAASDVISRVGAVISTPTLERLHQISSGRSFLS